MVNLEKYKYKTPAPSRQNLEKAAALIENNLAQMRLIAEKITAEKEQQPMEGKQRLLYFGSSIFDYYLFAEECLLTVARIIDTWVPASLDWRLRLIRLMQLPVAEKRAPLISPQTALLLQDYLTLYLNFHIHCATFSADRISKLIDNLDLLQNQLEKELGRFTAFFMAR